MTKKAVGGNISSSVWQLAEPLALELGLKLWDIRFVKEGADHYLRVFIDKEGGVSIDDCVDMSHALDKPLDDADLIDCSYCLEVSSPGAERTLSRDEHFKAYIGEKVKVKFIRAVDGNREYSGVLEAYENSEITFKSNEGKTFVFNKKEASFVKADDFDNF